MSCTKAPAAITLQIRELCENLNPGVQPVSIPIRPDPDSKPLDCFHSVRSRVVKEGGRIQFGWAIWEWPRVYIEAEHHAVYEPPSGPPWLDITPSPLPDITRRLFLPDDRAVYDYENEGVLRDNIRVALSDDPLIQDFFDAARARLAILNAIPGMGAVKVDVGTGKKLFEAEKNQRRLSLNLQMKYTPQNARCFCGSGEKFKRCHGQSRRVQR